MTPLEFLSLFLVITAVAAGVQFVRRRRHADALRALAVDAGMHFTPTDRFRLAPRVAQRIPVPGAAAVRIADLLYGTKPDGGGERYVFTTEYTTGVLRSKTGVRRVATLSDSSDLVFAPDELPLLEQYRHLLGDAKTAKP